MKNLLPNLSKVPLRVSLTLIGISPIVSYLLAICPVNSITMDEFYSGRWLPKIRQPASSVNSSDSGNPCYPPPQPTNVVESQPAPAAPSRRPQTYWSTGGRRLTDPKAIALFNLAPGTSRKAVFNRFNMGTWRGDASVYETADGLVQVNFNPSDRLLKDQLNWVGFVQ